MMILSIWKCCPVIDPGFIIETSVQKCVKCNHKKCLLLQVRNSWTAISYVGLILQTVLKQEKFKRELCRELKGERRRLRWNSTALIPQSWRVGGWSRKGASEFPCRLSHPSLLTSALCWLLLKASAIFFRGSSYEEYLQSRRRLQKILACLRVHMCSSSGVCAHICLLFRAYRWGWSFPWVAFCSSDQTTPCSDARRQEPALSHPAFKQNEDKVALFVCG